MVDAHRTWLEESGQLDRGRRARAERRVREVVERELTRRIWSDAGGAGAVEERRGGRLPGPRDVVLGRAGDRRGDGWTKENRMSRANVGLRLALAIGLVACSVLRLAAQEPLVQLDTLRVDVASPRLGGVPGPVACGGGAHGLRAAYAPGAHGDGGAPVGGRGRRAAPLGGPGRSLPARIDLRAGLGAGGRRTHERSADRPLRPRPDRAARPGGADRGVEGTLPRRSMARTPSGAWSTW